MAALSMHSVSDELISDGAVLTFTERRQLAEDVAWLRATYGPRWTRIPTGFGGRAEAARDQLQRGVVPVNVAASDPVRVINEIGAFARETLETTERLRGDVNLLSAALGADVSRMPLGQLRRLCRAVLRLADAAAPNPSWANPAEAYAATVVLSALGDDLRELAAARRRVYEEFSEDVWSLSAGAAPPAVDRWWQSARRRRVRNELAAATRTGRPPADVKRAVATLRRANELGRSVTDAWAAVSGRLGHFVDAGIPDVDGAAEALAAMHELQLALGDQLDVDRIRDLAAADAFVCEELAGPAGDISLTIAAWSAKAKRMAAPSALSYSTTELEQWAVETRDALAVLQSLKDATGRLRPSVRTAGQILQDVIVRDRVHELCEAVRRDDLEGARS